jgi:hypothetical protein
MQLNTMATSEYYKSPLTIFVVWHPANNTGIEYAEAIYNSFCRDIHSPLSRGLTIPVEFRYVNEKGKIVPKDINTSESDRNAIILLVDDEMFADTNWQTYMETLMSYESEETRIFPVALSKYAFFLNEDILSKKQFIDLTKISEDRGLENRINELRSRLLHDLSRFLFNYSSVADTTSRNDTPPPVKLFISHAKVDGELLATNFRDFIQSNTKLKTFFDVNDIADAADFEEEIVQNLNHSAIVVFLSDQYSTREWCRIEVIVAKRNKSPLVVVNNIQAGEKRSFPYLGNVPTVRYKESSFNEIIDLALYQVLNNLFLKSKLKKEVDLYSLEKQHKVYTLENAPELFNYIDIKRLQKAHADEDVLVIYPDPPLGLEELKVLNDIDESIQFITPMLIPKILKDE